MRDRIWVCRNGQTMLVAQMETRHILNAIRMIQRNPGWRESYLPRLTLELEIRKLPKTP